jgi:hypothetical protein
MYLNDVSMQKQIMFELKYRLSSLTYEFASLRVQLHTCCPENKLQDQLLLFMQGYDALH